LFSIKKLLAFLIKFDESFSLGSLLNQSQNYQGNPCGVYPDLSSFTGSGVIQISVACIKWSAPSQVHIIWYQSFSSWYRFYPILLFFFVICPGLCFVLVLLFVFLFVSCCVLVCVFVSFLFLFLFLVSFRLCVKKKIFLSSVSSKKKSFRNIKKKREEKKKKKVGVWSLNTKLRLLEAFFGRKSCTKSPYLDSPLNSERCDI